MKEFKLNTGRATHHAFYDSLPEFAQGYIEAAISSGIYYYSGSGSVVKINGLGVGEMPMDLLEGMAGDAIRFQIENAKALTCVCSRQGYDMQRAGRDFWFTRNRYGHGYWEQDLFCRLDELEGLTAPAEAAGGFFLKLKPLHANPDRSVASDWVVESDSQPIQATPEEWAAVNPASKSAPIWGG